ncbi:MULTISPECIES: DEAD/DEAH box helicase [Arthrobacter]|uniref:DEAD/DEAH box helicase n=2 Tax=Arthrobacter TaxID=1663 RepID=A0ABU9KGE2_9MICC|nr:DEAD/DEAH box helicase [Arthrobacter sp. YJM1]MDP5225955.1 DEAD/DEAH box helicase [Arthrobacter sp. YJM1]
MSPMNEPQSPAEKYQAALVRNRDSKSLLHAFRSTLAFDLDGFQEESCRALEAGRGVLLAAPTGAGKTILGEFAVFSALQRGLKAFYTTPIKALSNQKFGELAEKYGPENVGLLTGDSSINAHAPVIVMTTEVLRNMLYADSDSLDSLGYVVMDEVHYLADRFRGAVWEEVIIHLPRSVQLVSLSATVSNAEEFGAWLSTVRGDTAIVVSEHRPVPLWQHVLAGRQVLDLFAEGTEPLDEAGPGPAPGAEVNPELVKLARGSTRRAPHAVRARGRRERSQGRPEPRTAPAVTRASRPAVVRTLESQGLLPAIFFIFSRAACDAAVQQCAAADVWLTTERERRIIASRVDEASRDIPGEDLDVLGFWAWRDGLIRGIASHHAGLLPAFKETVERLFADGLVRVVFATETLALGVNMPARSVVLEKLDKFNGESRVNITAGEYTQLTGRAGRRGIDVEGHAVVLWHEGIDPAAVAGLASRRTYPLNSSFRPGYNMSINLLAQFGRERSREILESSFAQFQADRSVVELAREVRSREESLAGYAEAMTCHLGDFQEYARLRKELSDLEGKAAKENKRAARNWMVSSLSRLMPGDVIHLDSERVQGYAVVLNADPAAHEPRPAVLTNDHQLRRIGLADLQGPIEPLFRVRIGKSFNAKTPKDRRALASAMRHELHKRGILDGHSASSTSGRRRPPGGRGGDVEARIAQLRKELAAHPCNGCHDRENHARWGERWWRLREETDTLLARIQGRTNTIARTFDRLCGLLDEFGYLEEVDGRVQITAPGRRLRRIYGERDLLIAQALREGAFNDLDAAEMAAFASVLVFQAKRDDGGLPPRMPSISLESAVETVVLEWEKLSEAEAQHKLPVTGEPELRLVWPMYKWAKGRRLQDVLSGTELAAGDFVRWVRQVIDLLDQVAAVPELDTRVSRICREAITKIKRGVVSYSSLTD